MKNVKSPSKVALERAQYITEMAQYVAEEREYKHDIRISELTTRIKEDCDKCLKKRGIGYIQLTKTGCSICLFCITKTHEEA